LVHLVKFVLGKPAGKGPEKGRDSNNTNRSSRIIRVASPFLFLPLVGDGLLDGARIGRGGLGGGDRSGCRLSPGAAAAWALHERPWKNELL
jgi:hypothetical protein